MTGPVRRTVALLLAATLLSACSTDGQLPPTTSASGLRIETVAGGLEHGWDLGFLPDGKVLVSERRGRLSLVSSTQPGAQVSQVRADFGDVLAAGEGGLMGMVLEPDFAQTRQFITCQTYQENGAGKDVRLIRWRLAPDGASAERVGVLLSGLPIARGGGRHSGCRPTIAADGALLVGTGDSAIAANPQDRAGLGGKVLRLDLRTGGPAKGNPFAAAANANEQRIYSYGHRNVQGVAVRPGSGQVFTAEHGPDQNDEVNLIAPGRNYGWDPSRGGAEDSYDESVPMTDLERFPDAVPAIWESGDTTEAICAAAFLTGSQWGELDGALVVTALKGAKVLLYKLDAEGKVQSVTTPPEFNTAYGRLRAARTGPDGALYVTTSNGDDDKLLKITPA